MTNLSRIDQCHLDDDDNNNAFTNDANVDHRILEQVDDGNYLDDGLNASADLDNGGVAVSRSSSFLSVSALESNLQRRLSQKIDNYAKKKSCPTAAAGGKKRSAAGSPSKLSSIRKAIWMPFTASTNTAIVNKIKAAKNDSNGYNNNNSSNSCSTKNGSIGSMVKSKLYSSFPNLHNINHSVFRRDHSVLSVNKLGQNHQRGCDYNDENIKRVLKAVASDHLISSSPSENKIRRSVFVERNEKERFGFTLQSYSFRSRKSNVVERITYVDHVVLDTPAFRAGLRAGDVILAVNGRNIQKFAHKVLVQYISDHLKLRMVVLYENCVNRIDLCAKAVKLKKLLSDKMFEYKILTMQEERLVNGLPCLTQDEILSLFAKSAACPSPDSSSLILDAAKLDSFDRSQSLNEFVIGRKSSITKQHSAPTTSAAAAGCLCADLIDSMSSKVSVSSTAENLLFVHSEDDACNNSRTSSSSLNSDNKKVPGLLARRNFRPQLGRVVVASGEKSPEFEVVDLDVMWSTSPTTVCCEKSLPDDTVPIITRF